MNKCEASFLPTNEDTVECLFYSASVSLDASHWEHLCKQLNKLIQSLSHEYIWHRDEFQIHIPIENNDTEIPHLYSSTCFGDNLEDEWFIIYIIFELTRNFNELVVQVKDNDGDFLLIEAADYLPSWANPDTTENRVFIYNNHVHFITPEMADLQCKVDLKKALELIIQSPHKTQASNEIEQAILARVGKYPEKALENIYKAYAWLPRNLATLLTLKSNLIAPIVESYCNHDVIEAKCCCKNLVLDNCITVEVKFTKYLYAKLVHSELIPSVRKHVGLTNDKNTITGLKLLCGFHMLMNKSSNVNIFASKTYNQFINSLKLNGYFKDNIEGSKDYNELLNKAKDYFASVECPVNLQISHNITELMSSDEFLRLKKELKDICTVSSDESEEWLNINPDQLNDLLNLRYGKKMNLKNNNVISSETITTELSNFFKLNSDFEGIEQLTSETSLNNDIEFEPDEFIASLEKMLNILSTGNSNQDVDSDISYSDDDCANELKTKLESDELDNLKDNKNILTNIVQSLKEEKASTGPSSNLLRSLGVVKTDLLDSDDDDD